MIKIDNKILSIMRKAINDLSMIENGDRIAVGLSGGKDSSVLLAALSLYQRFSPQKFSLMAITIDLGFKDADFTPLINFCKELGVEYHIEHTKIAEVIFETRKETNPCSLCSKMRRGALNTIMNNRGFNKLALGHHSDDLMETFFLSLLYEGRLSTFMPKSFMDRTNITLIRPLIFAEEKNIAAAAKNLPIVFNPCPANHHTRREDMKEMIKSIQEKNPYARTNIFNALTKPQRNNLWK